jgi:hypothetical protein
MKANNMTKENLGEKIGSIQTDVSYIKDTLEKFTADSEKKYLTKEEFKPYKFILCFIGVAILGFIVSDVIEYYTKTRNKIISQQVNNSIDK